jgi:hypothetical protein
MRGVWTEPRARRATSGGAGPGAPAVALVALLGLAALVLAAGCTTLRKPSPPDPLAALSQAEHLLATGDEPAAARAYEAYLEAGDDVPGGDLALLRLALLRLEAGGPLYAPASGLRLLRRLLDAHPESPYAAAAEVILHLRRDNHRLDAEVARLREQLEELRRIDLGPGEKDPG